MTSDRLVSSSNTLKAIAILGLLCKVISHPLAHAGAGYLSAGMVLCLYCNETGHDVAGWYYNAGVSQLCTALRDMILCGSLHGLQAQCLG